MDDTAHDLVQVLPYTSGLRDWVVYLLEALDLKQITRRSIWQNKNKENSAVS